MRGGRRLLCPLPQSNRRRWSVLTDQKPPLKPVHFRDGFTRIRGQAYESETGTRIRVERQKLMHNFRGGYKPTGPKVPIFQGRESDAEYLYRVLDEWFGEDDD